ncbi:hypothetical protein IV203_002759 [Nitzschia inconspicua]|uniref:Uncharacterized protein n=1 Tax=Nitzschia inconspicua TaxID=303405 RepID=A0A9K3L0I2_9STRA|nr:hypothetical protein IV203_002759 [Nitzschia inconspicua]
MSNEHTTRYYPVTKKDHDRNEAEILKGDAYKNAKADEGMDTHTHTHRYVPAQHQHKWTAAPVQSGHTSRYFPVTPKDLKLDHDAILHCDAYRDTKENAGMDTNTHTSRYVPAQTPKSAQ